MRIRDASLVEKDEFMKLLTKERDQALATLGKHGLMADRNIEVSHSHSLEITPAFGLIFFLIFLVPIWINIS